MRQTSRRGEDTQTPAVAGSFRMSARSLDNNIKKGGRFFTEEEDLLKRVEVQPQNSFSFRNRRYFFIFGVNNSFVVISSEKSMSGAKLVSGHRGRYCANSKSRGLAFFRVSHKAKTSNATKAKTSKPPRAAALCAKLKMASYFFHSCHSANVARCARRLRRASSGVQRHGDSGSRYKSK